MARPKSTLTTRDLGPEVRGKYVLTPIISRETNTHIPDMVKLVEERAAELGIDLFCTTTICNEGLRVEWGPAHERPITEDEIESFKERMDYTEKVLGD